MPLYRQIADQIRDAILAGLMPPGEYLPASRALSQDLGVSRITALQAYDQLVAENFLEARGGSGTRVTTALEGRSIDALRAARRAPIAHADEHVQELYDGEPSGVVFQPGIPAFDAFPRLLWSKLLQRHALRGDQFILDYAHIGGYAPLRHELAKYLKASRGVTCEAPQVIVVTSVRAALATACSILLPRGAEVAVEDPGYVAARRVLAACGLRLHYVPVDEQGIRVDDPAFDPGACAGVYVTPAHQWPGGSTLSADRRLRLLDWAARSGGWILEDDYDSEFRFDSPPVAPIHALSGQHVVYMGTFSKTLVPSIRCAYLVVPPEFVSRFERQVWERGAEPALHVQAALSDLLSEGHFVQHIARMRKLYRRRREVLVRAIREVFDGRIRAYAPPGGLQVIAELPHDVPASEVARSAAKVGLVARPLTVYHVHQTPPNALHLGFAAVPEDRIRPGVERLKAAISALL